MTIKPDAGAVCSLFILVPIGIFLTSKIYIDLHSFPFFLFAFLLFAWLVCGTIAVGGRTIHINERGITVSFLGIRRHYAWAELQTARYVDVSKRLFPMGPYTRSVELSPKALKRSKRLPSDLYCALCHPFSLFFIYFTPAVAPKPMQRDFRSNTVSEEAFARLMKEWGVTIEKAE